jgi:hypothetical protein
MEVVVEVTGVFSEDLGMAVAGSTAGSEDVEALDTGLVANMASTLLSSSALVSESEGEKEGKGMIWGWMDEVEVAAEAQWMRRVSRDWVACFSP